MERTGSRRFFIAIGIQALILAVLGMSLLLTYRNGSEVLLAVQPVDPRDPLRGDYITFSLKDVSRISLEGKTFRWRKGEDVYVSLVSDGKYMRSGDVSKKKPEGKTIFLKGTIENASDKSISVKYGIEEYFIPEGIGRNLSFWDKDVSAKVAIDKDGKAVLKQIYIDDKAWP